MSKSKFLTHEILWDELQKLLIEFIESKIGRNPMDDEKMKHERTMYILSVIHPSFLIKKIGKHSFNVLEVCLFTKLIDFLKIVINILGNNQMDYSSHQGVPILIYMLKNSFPLDFLKECICDTNIDINLIENSTGYSFIMYLFSNENFDLIRFVLENRGDTDLSIVVKKNGLNRMFSCIDTDENISHLIFSKGKVDLLDILIDCIGDKNIQLNENNDDYFPFIVSYKKGYTSIVEKLLKYEGPINFFGNSCKNEILYYIKENEIKTKNQKTLEYVEKFFIN